MTITVRAKVRKIREHNVWSVTVYAEHGYLDPYPGEVVTQFNHRYAMTMTWGEAVKTALQLRSGLELQLMDEVHASRTARRAATGKHQAEELTSDNLYQLETTA